MAYHLVSEPSTWKEAHALITARYPHLKGQALIAEIARRFPLLAAGPRSLYLHGMSSRP
jgi:hypothetical protein